MEALEFLKERKRMCRFFGGSCKGCPCENVRCEINAHVSDDDYKRVVATVEEWSAAHPLKTRQSVFLEQWPEAHVSANGSLCLCPASVSAAYRDENGICKVRRLKCTDCCKEFWGQEVE